jgi:molybdopterin converting factor small subunit
MPHVRLRGTLKRLADDRPEHAIDAATVDELLRTLEREHPALAGWVLDERGRLRPHINVFVNGERASQQEPLAAEDCVDVLPAISGG